MKTVNGWSDRDIQTLISRTGRPEEIVLRFCRAVDKQLYLLLPEHIKKATLHFHLSRFLHEGSEEREEYQD